MIDEDFDVILTTYGLIKSDYEYYKEKNFDFCIIDEAQNIRIHIHRPAPYRAKQPRNQNKPTNKKTISSHLSLFYIFIPARRKDCF